LHILIVLKAVAALLGRGYGFFDFSLEKKIRKQVNYIIASEAWQRFVNGKSDSQS